MSRTHPLAVASSMRTVLLLAAVVLLVTSTAQAVNNPVDGTVGRWWKDAQGNSGTVSFDTKWWLTQHDGWDGHVTTNNAVEFNHHHVQNEWPRGGHTATEAKRFFDDKWQAHQAPDSFGTANPKHNCYSYAYGRTDYWVNSQGEILANDYPDADKSDATVGYWSGHACKVVEQYNDCGAWKIVQIYQKDRGSAFFSFVYTNWDLKLAPHYTSEATLKKPK